MKLVRKAVKPVSVLLALIMVFLSGPNQAVLAAIVGTETVLSMTRSDEARGFINDILAREDIQAALIAQGIDPNEAKTRIDCLSDAEVRYIADKLDQVPAGGVFETLLILAFLVFLILLITDIAGYTEVFPFVKKYDSKKIDRGDTAIETGKQKDDYSSGKDIEVRPGKNLIIYFRENSNELSDKAITQLDEIYDIMRGNPEAELAIVGFTDSEVSPEYNKMLSENRVYTVKMYLVGKGLKPDRTKIEFISTQKNPPIDGIEVRINPHPKGDY
jgi:hypothetical protein